MNWKKPVFMLGAVLLCTSLLMANTPPGQITASPGQQQLAPAPVSSAQAATVPDKAQFKAQREALLKQQQPAAKTRAVNANTTAAVPGVASRGDATITIEILTDNYGSETSWELWERDGAMVASGSGYANNTLYVIDVDVYSTSCYDWTIYDSYGDGICCAYGDGYYNVFYNSELMCTGGDFGSSESCEGLGGGCPEPPTGACCVAGVCVATTYEADCAGSWFEGETCPEYICPETDADFLVTAPCEGATQNTCGAGDDCAIRAGADHTYEVIIPWDGIWTFSLCGGEATWDTYLYLGSTLCSGEIAYNDDYCGVVSEINSVTLYAGNYFIDVEPYSSSGCGDYALDIWEEVPPTGACCVDQVCVETDTELECGTLGGIWYAGQDCDAGFECPIPGEGDFCEDPIIIESPYPVTVLGTNIGMTVDCPGLLDWNAQWYQLELPYASNRVDVTLCPTAVDTGTVGIILMDDCACDDYIISTYEWITCGNGYLGLHQWWNDMPGPGTILFPAYIVDGLGNPIDFEATFDVTEVQPCIIDCEDTEGEGPCYDGYWDTYNGGCNVAPEYPLQPLACGETVCGMTGVYVYNGVSYRDMDWYEVTLTSAGLVTWSAQCEVPMALWLLSGTCTGGIVVEEFASQYEPCTQLTLSHAFPAGTYIALISTPDWGAYPCGARYEATLSCGEVMGACCYGEDPFNPVCENTNEATCDGLGGDWYLGEDCASFDCPIPCTESQIDIAILTDPYPSETTWQITDHNTGQLICSGGPYAAANTLYEERCCIGYTDCVDFTIYDSYGDGIYAPGGYTIWLDGEIIFDCMGDGWYGSIQTVDNFGGGCVQPTGACCVDLVCVATNYENECDALDGRWYEGETCPDFVCPDCDVDYCVTAPFTSELLGTCGAGNDCALRTTEEHEYEVTILTEGLWNFNTCLDSSWDTYLYLGTGICTSDIGENDDSCGLQSEIIVYIGPGVYYCTIEGYSTCGNYIFDVHEEVPCVVECPEDGIPEAEECGADTNGGCNMTSPQFEPIACNTTVCGTGWFDGGTRDTDWYEYIPTNDDTMTFAVEAEFDVLFGLIEQIVPGVPGCDNITGYVAPYALMPDCTPASVSFPVAAGGTYYLFVAPQFTGIFTCDMPTIDYVATLTGEACMCGDFDQDGDVDVDDFYFFLDAFGTCEGDIKYEEACDFDGDACITLVDYQMWMQCYRDANGKGFVAPFHKTSARPAGQQAPMRPLTP